MFLSGDVCGVDGDGDDGGDEEVVVVVVMSQDENWYCVWVRKHASG